MARDYVDWTEFDSPLASLDLVKNSIKESIEYDAYGKKKNFKAIVLTPAKRIDRIEAKALGVPAKENMTFQSPAFKFKIRIVEDNSPHILLPDPCNLAINADRRFVESIIELHTDVVFFRTNGLQPPGAGDLIEVKLKKNDFTYNLQKAEFVKVIARNSSPETFLSNKGCSLIFEKFEQLESFVSTTPSTISSPAGNNIVISTSTADSPLLIYFYPGVGYGTLPYVKKVIEGLNIGPNTIIILGETNRTSFSSMEETAKAALAGKRPSSIKLGGWSGGAIGLASALGSGQPFNTIIYADPSPGALIGKAHRDAKMYYKPSNWKGDLAHLGEKQKVLAAEMGSNAELVSEDHNQILTKTLKELIGIG
jgi:hypothetical protein